MPPRAAANPALALRSQSTPLAGWVDELASLGDFDSRNVPRLNCWATAGICVLLLCSCAMRDSARSALPAEAAFNEGAGAGGLWSEHLLVTLRLETGEELLFIVDTGAPITVLDKSLVPRPIRTYL
jgi:hypothetical protein